MYNFGDENSRITVSFRVPPWIENHKPTIMIQCRPKDKVLEIIEKNREENNDYSEERKFIYNAKVLEPSLTLEESGINNFSNIFVTTASGVKGSH